MRFKITLFGILSIFLLLLASGIGSSARAAVIGIDVSKYQGTIDWDTAQHSFNFAFIKAGGADAGFYQDPQFTRNRDEARRLGIARGYYFFAGGGDPVQEADYFYSIVGQLQPGEAIALDFEIDHPYPIGWVQAFMTRTDQLFGVKALFYTYMKRVWSYDWSPVAHDGHPLWGAIYDDNYTQPAPGPFSGLLIKQFTSSGSVPGISTAVDINVYNDSFNFNWFHDIGYVPPPPPPPPAPAPAPSVRAQGQPASAGLQPDGTVADNGSAGNASQDSGNQDNGGSLNGGSQDNSGSQDATSPGNGQDSWFATLFVNPALTDGVVTADNTDGQTSSSAGTGSGAAGDGAGTATTSGPASGSAQDGKAGNAQDGSAGNAQGGNAGSTQGGSAGSSVSTSGQAASSAVYGAGNGSGAATTGTDSSRPAIPSWNLSQTPPLDKVDRVTPDSFAWLTDPPDQKPQKSMTAPLLIPKLDPLPLMPAT